MNTELFDDIKSRFVVVVGCFASIIAIYLFLPRISEYITPILTFSKEGTEEILLSYFGIFIFCLIFVLMICVLITLILKIKNLNSILGQQPKKIIYEYDRFLHNAQNLRSIIYPGNEIEIRQAVVEKKVCHKINTRGDTSSDHTYHIECVEGSLHFFGFEFNTDDEGTAVPGYNDLKILIKYRDIKDDGSTSEWRKTNFLPTVDALRQKAIIVFFEEMKKDDVREIKIAYQWPGYWKQLLERGSTIFHWARLKEHPNKPQKIHYEWIFDSGMPRIDAEELSSPPFKPRIENVNSNGIQKVTFKENQQSDDLMVKFKLRSSDKN